MYYANNVTGSANLLQVLFIHFRSLTQVQVIYFHMFIIPGAILIDIFHFKVCEEFKVRKLVFSSSSCVYGNPSYLPIDENHPTGVGITNPYGRTKYFTEEIIKDMCTANKV